MNTRLKQFLSAENMTQAQFADKLKVVRASVSHILAGRNNPSYDFLKALLENYPNLNMEWLFLGKGKMYKESSRPEVQQPIPQDDLEPLLFAPQENEIREEVHDIPENIRQITGMDDSIHNIQHAVTQRKVSKIIILFDDGSYQEM